MSPQFDREALQFSVQEMDNKKISFQSHKIKLTK